MKPLWSHREVYEEAKANFQDWYGDDLAKRGGCLYWTQVAMRAFWSRGIRAVLQAGNLHWKIIPDEQDDGVINNWFGYEWTPHEPLSAAAIAAGQLPEVHIWCGLPETQEIVDFSTAYLKHLAESRHGLRWTMPDPPLYVWGKPDSNYIRYLPNREATRFVAKFMIEKFTQEKQAA